MFMYLCVINCFISLAMFFLLLGVDSAGRSYPQFSQNLDLGLSEGR